MDALSNFCCIPVLQNCIPTRTRAQKEHRHLTDHEKLGAKKMEKYHRSTIASTIHKENWNNTGRHLSICCLLQTPFISRRLVGRQIMGPDVIHNSQQVIFFILE